MEEKIGEGGLVRELKFTMAVSVVVGTVIGSGIFIGANRVAAASSSAWMMFAIWIGAGLLTLLGALTYAEFGAMYPRSGGDYVYVSKSVSPFFGFFVGWASFSINLPASTAALAIAFASQMDALKPDLHGFLFFEGFATRFTAVGVIVLFTVINYFGVKIGGRTQRTLTFAKVGLMLLLVVIALMPGNGDAGNLGGFFSNSRDATIPFIGAVVAALFAYDGWNAVSRVAGEVRNPQRLVPRALMAGVLSIIAIYVLVNLGYLLILGLDGMAHANPGAIQFDVDRLIASRAAQAVLGNAGEAFVAIVIAVSVLGTINGLILSGPRIYFAMARDRLFFPSVGEVHPRHRTPHRSIMMQGAISALLALFFTFEQLQNYVVLAAWVAYSLTGIGLLLHRRRHPELARPYKVPFYPLVPLLFTGLALAFLVYLFIAALPANQDPSDPPWEQMLYFMANVVVLLGSVPLYLWLRARYGGTPADATSSN
ncbi:MAG: amino acid permease [Euryarchaeota archaeon]|nr:amino acid permease [Euryarchaeota archaeon]